MLTQAREYNRLHFDPFSYCDCVYITTTYGYPESNQQPLVQNATVPTARLLSNPPRLKLLVFELQHRVLLVQQVDLVLQVSDVLLLLAPGQASRLTVLDHPLVPLQRFHLEKTQPEVLQTTAVIRQIAVLNNEPGILGYLTTTVNGKKKC